MRNFVGKPQYTDVLSKMPLCSQWRRLGRERPVRQGEKTTVTIFLSRRGPRIGKGHVIDGAGDGERHGPYAAEVPSHWRPRDSRSSVRWMSRGGAFKR